MNWVLALFDKYAEQEPTSPCDLTREEALQILDTIPTIGEQVDALEMAIQALEQEPTTRKSCETCIGKSRYVDGMDLCEDCEKCSNFKPKQTIERR